MSDPRHPVDDMVAGLPKPTMRDADRTMIQDRLNAAIREEMTLPAATSDMPSPDHEHVVDLRPVATTRRRRILGLAAGFGLAAIVFANLMLPLLTGQGPGPTSPSMPTPVLVGPGEVRWNPTSILGQGPALAEGSDGLVMALGSEIWFMPADVDQSVWDQTPEEEGTTGWVQTSSLPVDGLSVKLTAGGDLIIATVDSGSDPAASTDVWVSSDQGHTWASTKIAGTVNDMAHTPTGFVAVGTASTADTNPKMQQAAAWTSDNGLTWHRLESLSPTDATVSAADIVVWADGKLVILGVEGSGSDSTPTTWTTTGRHAPVDSAGSDLPSRAISAIASPHGIVAATTCLEEKTSTCSTLWLSRDGIAWDPINVPGGDWIVTALTLSETTTYMTAHTNEPGRTAQNTIWSSQDLVRWTHRPLPESFNELPVTPHAVAITGELIAVAGIGDGRGHIVIGLLDE